MRLRRFLKRRTAPTLGAIALLGSAFAVATTASNSGSANAALATGFPPKNTTIPASSQFDVTGFLKTAKVDAAGDAHSGGTMMVDGHLIVVPRETVVILPASALTWQELFAKSPAPYTGTATGMALDDSPKPTTTYEVHVIGNRVEDDNGVNGCTQAAGCDRYIAGLINISQQDLNNGAGYISSINYTTGEIEVGGQPNTPGTGARVRINDPAAPGSSSGGRYGRAASPDTRFMVDQDNPTISSETGFPMCIPRTTSDPNLAGNPDDPECPRGNRPKVSAAPVVDTSGINPQPNALVPGAFYTVFRMDDPASVDGAAGAPACLRAPCADPRKQAPFEIGDYVDFAGTFVADGGTDGGYVSAHTITASLGIYTQPGKDPAYVNIEVGIIGTGGLTVFGAGEAAVRTRFEGMSTDETRAVHLYGIDINPVTGATSDRDWGTTLPDLGPPLGAVRGRWRFRPPCTATAATLQPGKGCTPPPAGQFIPPTREVRAVIEGLQTQVPGSGTEVAVANGIDYGQYHAPIEEYIFPENVPGTVVPENNFNTLPFLAQGGYASVTGVQAGILNPWPSSVGAIACAKPTAGGPYSVPAGGNLLVNGAVAANATQPVTIAWTTTGGTLTGATTATPTLAAPAAAGSVTLTMTTTGPCGTETSTATVTVTAVATPPAINPIAAQSIIQGGPVTISASSSATPAPTFAWSQVGTTPVQVVPFPVATTTTTNGVTTSKITFTPSQPGLYTFSAKATNVNGQSSATATVNVIATNVVLTPVEYRTSKQRLVITATTPDLTVATMKLQPYVTDTGATFDPATLGANLSVTLGAAPGTFSITLVGAPHPACGNPAGFQTPCTAKPLSVLAYQDAAATKLVGASVATALDRIRQ